MRQINHGPVLTAVGLGCKYQGMETTPARPFRHPRHQVRPSADIDLTAPRPISQLDILLGPDPGPLNGDADHHYRVLLDTAQYRSVNQTQTALDAAYARHTRDLARRFAQAQVYNARDFSVKDLRLCWTQRQLAAGLWWEIVALLAVVLGLVLNLTVVLVAGAIAALVLVPFLVRDGWRRAHLWMLEER